MLWTLFTCISISMVVTRFQRDLRTMERFHPPPHMYGIVPLIGTEISAVAGFLAQGFSAVIAKEPPYLLIIF